MFFSSVSSVSLRCHTQYSEDEPEVPYLVQAYEDPAALRPDYEAAAANNGFDTSTNAVPIRLNETVDMVFLNLASFAGTLEAHPWHSEHLAFLSPSVRAERGCAHGSDRARWWGGVQFTDSTRT